MATFLLSTLQVLGNLGFKAPHVSPSEPFHLDCDELVTANFPHTHHLFLQARVEVHHAYLMYVQIGFTNVNANFTCTSFQNNCPVNRSKKAKALEAGYSTDDDLLRLLVLQKWIVNVWPITAKVLNQLSFTMLLDYRIISIYHRRLCHQKLPRRPKNIPMPPTINCWSAGIMLLRSLWYFTTLCHLKRFCQHLLIAPSPPSSEIRFRFR